HYQLTNVMQQLDPHFLFNALSNISSYYHKGDQEHAQSYLAKVSRLVRTTLENSERMTISMEEEITFVKDYLSVEQIRMGDRLNYSIELDEGLQKEIQIPKMLIQNFVENAVKHGIRHLVDRKGVIRIYSRQKHGYAEIVIEDNGVGRKQAAEIGSTGTGNGLIMVQKSLDIFEKLEKVRIVFRIEDVEGVEGQGQEAGGTRVVLNIP
ncbi:MAG: histidine kinase, partial [Bacteroides sp.]|nr:histidine kinase [Bacteroides sp.]